MKNRNLRWLVKVPGAKKGYILALTLAQAVYGASGVFFALLLRSVVDCAAGGDRDGFFRAMFLTVCLVAGQLLLRALVRFLEEYARSTFENVFKARLTDTLLHRDCLQVSAVHTAEWLNRLTSDTVVVAGGYVDILPGLAGMSVKLISALIMIAALEPRFAAVMIPGGILMVLFTWLFRRILKRLHREVQESDGRLRVFLQERLGALFLIRSFAAEDRTLREAEQKMGDHRAARMKKNHFHNFCNLGFGAAMMGMYLLGIGWCGYGILMGTISFGTLTAITQLIAQIQTPFAGISGFLPRFYACLASAERLMEAEDFAGSGDRAMSLEEVRAYYREELAAFGLRDVSFSYGRTAEGGDREEVPVLSGLSLEVAKGETVAFTGHSGCGKSTALRLLMCVYEPGQGERYRRGADGSTGKLDARFRRLFAYVPQGNALMSGTIREAVAFADPDHAGNEERLRRALAAACADGFVDDLPEGADTLLGERGAGLSEGQMQRLAIARAVFSGSPVLLLDEATSALDAETERELLKNLQTMTDKTVVIVTHRPAALAICDRVLEFSEKGVILCD